VVCSPKDFGGLGVKDLILFSRALRLRWEWLNWTDVDRPWHGLPLPLKKEDLVLFHACTAISLGNGDKALFWKDPWHNGMTLQLAFPELFRLARRKRIYLSRMPCRMEFAELWTLVQSTHLSDNEDAISWTKSSDSTYSASTAYLTSFSSSTPKPLLAAIWDTKMEGKVKFFLWLILQNRLWTGQRL
jgi:hypothetical protein